MYSLENTCETTKNTFFVVKSFKTCDDKNRLEEQNCKKRLKLNTLHSVDTSINFEMIANSNSMTQLPY